MKITYCTAQNFKAFLLCDILDIYLCHEIHDEKSLNNSSNNFKIQK